MSQWLIQGFFAQEHLVLGKAHRAESEGGIGVTVQEIAVGHMWAGVISTSKHDESRLRGGLMDDFGESVLSNITITDDELSFTKKYRNREDSISYSFKRKDNYWVGEYSGKAVGKGAAHCILTEMPKEFFDVGGQAVK